MIAPTPLDPPRRLTSDELADRYNITARLATEWLRRMQPAGVVRKIGRVIVGRLSACDEWVANGGAVAESAPKRRYRGVRP